MAQNSAPARRPRDRRQRIIDSAAEQFRIAGYHNVGITDIAEAVGITSAALYRHFGGKQDLLFATVDAAIGRLRDVLATPNASLEVLLHATCALAMERPQVAVLWSREIAHLSADLQSELRIRLLNAIAPLRSALAIARPELSADVIDLLLWATTGAIASTDTNPTKVDVRRYRRRLLEACLAISQTTTIQAVAARQLSPTSSPEQQPSLLPVTRQEAILAAATRLFCARGYQAVSIDDIGAAVGMMGASVYHHFPNKSAILGAGLNRGMQALFFDLVGALDNSGTSQEALCKLLRGFVRIGLEHGLVIVAMRSEAIYLPRDERRALLETQADYVAEWVSLLMRSRTDLSDADAHVLVHATLSSFGAMLNIPHLRHRPDFGAELVAIGSAALGLR